MNFPVTSTYFVPPGASGVSADGTELLNEPWRQCVPEIPSWQQRLPPYGLDPYAEIRKLACLPRPTKEVEAEGACFDGRNLQTLTTKGTDSLQNSAFLNNGFQK
ncbi:unnamed protein product [Dibothriocephalus latus]|uniref:Uncharacterized protein n=1 Tax=Dibothriocephalus latus TaxID=60516 RepID=A0A3P7NN40_DIBLA|nr:unnamed protein product [Dibothriocephalus latus]